MTVMLLCRGVEFALVNHKGADLITLVATAQVGPFLPAFITIYMASSFSRLICASVASQK